MSRVPWPLSPRLSVVKRKRATGQGTREADHGYGRGNGNGNGNGDERANGDRRDYASTARLSPDARSFSAFASVATAWVDDIVSCVAR